MLQDFTGLSIADGAYTITYDQIGGKFLLNQVMFIWMELHTLVVLILGYNVYLLIPQLD